MTLTRPARLPNCMGTGFDYWALGHIHQRFEERGRATIVMPGNPQGRDINEAGPKSATLVDDRRRPQDHDRGAADERRRVSARSRSISPASTIGGTALKRIEKALDAARAAAPSEHLVARLTLAGATPLAWRLRSDADVLAEESRALGAAIGKTWIDKIELDCAAPARAGAPPSSDPVAELRALMETEVAQSKAFQDALSEIAEELRRNLPHGIARRPVRPRRRTNSPKSFAHVASEGAEDVLAHLRAADRDLAA